MIIEICGIDGSGKSTQLELLQGWANEHGVACYERKLRPIGRRVLGGLAQAAGYTTWRDLYDSDSVELMTAVEMRQQVYEYILPITFPGQLIVTDTYIRLWIANALSWGADPTRLIPIYATIPAPDVSFFLEVSTDVAFERIMARPKSDHIQRSGGRDRLHRLAMAYEALPQYVGYEATTIDGTQSPDAIFRVICAAVEARAQGDRV